MTFDLKNNTLKQSTNCKAALELAEQGFAVFPVHHIMDDGECSCGKKNCSSPGKHPLTSNGVKAATRDPNRIKRLWRKNPKANVGIATGGPSGFFALDVDRKNDGFAAFAKLEKEHGKLPFTKKCKTGDGGFHLYFKMPAGATIPNSAGKVAKGIDIRGEGGYVIAPPSNHHSGGGYEWVN
jgi:hypothetical protein